jgi:putative transposase
VIPGIPHHITQRGNRKQLTFFNADDYQLYTSLMTKFCRLHRVGIWAYCFMPNHVHLVAVPESEDGLRRSIGEAHRRYTLKINTREGWKGHLWQGRFASYPMDEKHLLMAVRYIEQNPLRAGLVRRPQDWPWSSAAAHLSGKDDGLVTVKPLLEMVPVWMTFLTQQTSGSEAFEKHERTGRPLGSLRFIKKCESVLGKALLPQKPGPKGAWKHTAD